MASYDRRIDLALETIETEEIPHSLPESLPLLDDLRRKESRPGAFADVDVLFVQHHLGPFTVRLRAMCEDGLDMARAWFVDIPYSTCLEAREAAYQGCPEGHTVQLFADPLDLYEEAQFARVLILMQQLAVERRARLLVVDDGAYFLRALHRLHATRPVLAARFAGSRVVEQTTRGHRVVVRSEALIQALGLAVVSVAACDTKKMFESPFIGASLSRAIGRALRNDPYLSDGIQRAAVLGFGPVGEAVTAALLRAHPRLPIDVVEPDPSKHPRIRALSATPRGSLPDSLADDLRYDLVAGCTGRNAFKLHERRLLARHGVLASCSSAAVEFNRAGFIELADAYPDDELEVLDREALRQGGLHATITIQHEQGRRMHFLNAGFPVNFDGAMENLPVRAIQATHCLLFHASRQVLAIEKPGVHLFDEQIDGWLLEHAPAAL